MKTEYIIWGIPQGKQAEEILFTKAETLIDAQNVCKILEGKHNCTKCRVQIINFNDNDINSSFIKSIK